MALPAVLAGISAATSSIKTVLDILGSSSRSVLLEVDNNTDLTLQRIGDHHRHGAFKVPPHTEVAPRSAEVFGSANKGGSIATGTEGNVLYSGPGFEFLIRWNNPYAGSNKGSAELKGKNAPYYRAIATIGGGNDARMRYELFGGPVGQTSWGWCHKCQGLFFTEPSGDVFLGRCPTGGQHSTDGSGNYSLAVDLPNFPAQPDWRWCHRCQGLFYGGRPSTGVCAAGGGHAGDLSGNYSLVHDTPGAPGQDGWRWCARCEGMYFAGNATPGVCPAGGAHTAEGSGAYTLLLVS